MLLSVQHINKSYQKNQLALDDVCLEISAGMYGLLGPNGAGKSTLMRILATLQKPDNGNILFNGQDIFLNTIAYRKKLGYLPQTFGVYANESAHSLLDYFALLKGISNKNDRLGIIEKVLDLTNLLDVQYKKVKEYSGGMKQRFGIAQLLLNQPDVIVVDEPTNGLDPAERSRFLNVLRKIGNKNIVLFSTHLVADVQSLCQNFAIINSGRIISEEHTQDAIHQIENHIWESTLSKNEIKIDIPNAIFLSDRYDTGNTLIQRIYSEDNLGPNYEITKANLEDYYFYKLHQSRS